MVDKLIMTTRRDHFSSEASPMAVGLGFLVSNVHEYKDNSNTILVSSTLRLRLDQHILNTQTCHADVIIPPPQHYLKSCFLCRKRLSPDKDIYMYRGDKGFCSVECRNHQIIVDDKKELEVSTKKMVAAYRRCSGRSESGVLLDDLRRRNNPIQPQKVRQLFLIGS